MRTGSATRAIRIAIAAIVASAVLPQAADAAPKLKLQKVAGLPPNAARHLANGTNGEVWMTSDLTGNFVARLSKSGTLLKVVPVPGRPDAITRGPDGAMWTTLRDVGRVARVTREGAVSLFTVPLAPGSEPRKIVTGPDGALWMTLFRASAVARLTTAGQWSIFKTGLTPGGEQLGLASAGGALWLTEPRADRIVRMTTAGVGTGFAVSNASGPEDIAPGLGGDLWFTEDDGDRIGRITKSGKVTEFSAGITPGGNPFNIVRGPDDAMWFTEAVGNRIGRATPDGFITEYDLPAGAVPRGIIRGPGKRLWVALAGTGDVARFKAPPAPEVPGGLAAAWDVDGSRSTFDVLLLTGLKRFSRVTAKCKGACPRRSFEKSGVTQLNLRKQFPSLGRGAELDIRISATGYSTKVRILEAASGGITAKSRCITPNTKKLRKTCG
jgi:virginiamycin B lyase